MKRRKIISIAFILSTAITFIFPIRVFAKQNTDLMVDIGDVKINVAKIAYENNVNPYDLKEAIINGTNAERTSPFYIYA